MTNLEPDGDSRLGELLRQAVPDGPDPAGRARDVVRRAHRANHRRGVASVAAVGIVALAVVAGPSLMDSVGGDRGTVAPLAPAVDTSRAAAQLHHPYQCPAAPAETSGLRSSADGRIATGAVLARICPSVVKNAKGLWSAPLDALTVGVDRVIEQYNRLPRLPSDAACTLEGHLDNFTVTFQYADGHLAQVDGVTSGCDVVAPADLPDQARMGAAQTLSAYLRALVVQRADRNPPRPAAISPPSCPARYDLSLGSLLPATPRLGLKQAIFCTYDPRPGSQARLRAAALLDPAILSQVNADYDAHVTSSSRGVSCMNPQPPVNIIVGVTEWGDEVRMQSDCYAFQREGSTGGVFWTPSDATYQMLYSSVHH